MRVKEGRKAEEGTKWMECSEETKVLKMRCMDGTDRWIGNVGMRGKERKRME